MFTQLLAEDRELITYRKNLNKITGSVLSTILLQQIIFRANQKDGKPFYKFKEPCSNELYKQGDSWTEELGFTKYEFDTALKRIATKSTKGAKKKDLMIPDFNKPVYADKLIIYWTDSNRLTWYWLNSDLLDKWLLSIYLENGQSNFIYKVDNSGLPFIQRQQTKTTSDIYTPPENSKTKKQPEPDFDDGADLEAQAEMVRPFIDEFEDNWYEVSKAEWKKISALARKPGASLERWQSAVAAMTASKVRTVDRAIEIYEAGGTWEEMCWVWNEREQAAQAGQNGGSKKEIDYIIDTEFRI